MAKFKCFFKKNTKKLPFTKFGHSLPPKIYWFMFFSKKNNKKSLKLVKNKQKNEVLPPKLAKNGPKWPKNQFFWKNSCFFQIWPFLPPNISGFLDFFEKKQKTGPKLVKNQTKMRFYPRNWPKMVQNGKKKQFFFKNMFFSKFGYFLPHKISGFMVFCEKNNNKKVPKIVKNKKNRF